MLLTPLTLLPLLMLLPPLTLLLPLMLQVLPALMSLKKATQQRSVALAWQRWRRRLLPRLLLSRDEQQQQHQRQQHQQQQHQRQQKLWLQAAGQCHQRQPQKKAWAA